ncbi:hypothetical protein F4V57_03165 [Acinetobacter qingfengensis]|uniref:DdrR n=1 Tax=Acinetobacter qingfengensis TaxID=1262585 RepID=A0A1E7REW2_9GAMM|nr:hypothetical protein [Acinetobacter qingfengensis]KAA8734776.1 hypothetical protein F4V57_03165 [Acinetobacter qingfengensis]OEY97695.1 hypothetical protein BJI46_08775 [Acinetobacter qingfengensis]
MNIQRDAILGYADERQVYFIQFIENNTVMGERYGLLCQHSDAEVAESIMTTLFLKKSFWLNGSEFQDIVKGLMPITI